MRVHLAITGTTPLLMHSAAGINPDHPLIKAMAPLTAKASNKRTDDDRREIARLEWLVGLYTGDDGAVVYPTANIVRCFVEAGKVTKQGKQVSRGLAFSGIDVPLNYAGRNGNVEKLFDDPNFVDVRPVGIGTKRVMRTRPRFMPWSLEASGHLFDDVLDIDDVERIAALAGRSVGLGDNRINGFGRFDVKVTVA